MNLDLVELQEKACAQSASDWLCVREQEIFPKDVDLNLTWMIIVLCILE